MLSNCNLKLAVEKLFEKTETETFRLTFNGFSTLNWVQVDSVLNAPSHRSMRQKPDLSASNNEPSVDTCFLRPLDWLRTQPYLWLHSVLFQFCSSTLWLIFLSRKCRCFSFESICGKRLHVSKPSPVSLRSKVWIIS